MWVQVKEWMLADSEPARPLPGSVLHSVAVRVRGTVTAPDSSTPDGIAELAEPDRFDSPLGLYAVTGIASSAQDVWTSTKRLGPGQHSGAECVVTMGADRFQVQFDGHAVDVVAGSRVTVTGALGLVGDYEWDAFELTDTRADWLVTEVVDLPGGDIRVALAPVPVGTSENRTW